MNHNYPSYVIHSGKERDSHKYIKREWSNGKWKYWYKDTSDSIADKLGVDERKALNQQKTVHQYKLKKRERSESDRLDQRIRVEYRSDDSKEREKYRKLVVKSINDSAEVYKSEQKIKQLTEAYLNTPMGKVDHAAARGAKFVEDILGITALKEKLENKKDQRKIEEDTNRRNAIATDEARRKAKIQKAKRDADLRREKQAFEKEAERVAAEVKARAKAQKIVRNKAIEKERIRLREESAKKNTNAIITKGRRRTSSKRR